MNSVIKSLMNYALENGITCFAESRIPSDFPCFFTIKGNVKKIMINLNWHNQRQLPYIVAHEISHALTCDETDFCLYQKDMWKLKYEFKANSGAVKLLIPFYKDELDELEQVNVYRFMDEFEIPNTMYDVCVSNLKTI